MRYSVILCGLFISLFSVLAAFAQGTDTTAIKKDLDSAWSLMRRTDPLSLVMLKNTLAASRKINFKNGEGSSFYTAGKYYQDTGNSDVALLYYDSAFGIFEQTGNKAKMSQCYLMKGIVHLLGNNFPLAVQFCQKSVDLSTEIGKKSLMADGLTNLGESYERMGEFAKANEVFFKCLKIDEEENYKSGIAQDLSSIALIYGKMGDISKAVEFFEKSISMHEDRQFQGSTMIAYGIFLKNNGQYDKALQMHEKALAIFIEFKNQRGIYTSMHNLGAAYQAKGEYQKALSYYNQSLSRLTEKNQNQKNALQSNYLSMAETYFALKRYPASLEFANKAVALSTEIKLKEAQFKGLKLLSDIYQAQSNYQQAFHYYQQYVAHKDSIYNEEKSRQIKDLQTKYDTEKKAQEITLLTQERAIQDASLQKKTVVQYSLIAGILILIVFGLLIFRNHRAKQEVKRQLLAEQLRNEHVEAERLKELDHLKSRFFANIAHEFRTPLTLILGPVENLIADTKSLSDKTQLSMVKNNASRLVKLVNQLLDLSKLEAGAIKFDYVNEDIISFLKANTFAFQSLADQKKISISFTSDVPTLSMKFDRDKLEKICSNLLSNAFKFTNQEGSVRVTVLRGDNSQGKSIKVIVEDSGPGISTDDLKYVFNRFYQSGTVSRSTLGSGIGLELTKELVELCGGEIGVANASGGGAQFSFTVPVITGETGSENKTFYTPTYDIQPIDDSVIVTPIINDGTGSQNQEIILVIEDNDEVRNYIVSSLQSDYQIITAVNGGEGIAKALDNVPDLIISDVMMPVKDGIEVCATLKEDERTSHIPIIMLTAKADIESKIEGLQSGADDYLAKPFHTKELLTRIKNLILVRRKLQEKFQGNIVDKSGSKEEEIPMKERLFISRLRETIELHLAEEEYSVEELSRDMAMSRMQLHRKVKALTASSTSLYIRSIRLVHARRLLTEGIYNVSEVAYRVGFNSPTYFSTCFSEEFGFPPSDIKSHQAHKD